MLFMLTSLITPGTGTVPHMPTQASDKKSPKMEVTIVCAVCFQPATVKTLDLNQMLIIRS
jgi:hypothetical protein